MTKPITAVALLMLYEEGRLQLDDPVSKYLPAFRNQRVKTADGGTVPANREITLRDVMTNTAGVPSYAVIYEPGIDTESPMRDVVNRLAEYPLNFQPGTAFEYGFGISIAGVVVETVSGKTLEDFFQERIFRPLGMSGSSFFVPASKASRLMTEYEVKQEAGGTRLEPADLYTSDKVNGPKVQFGGDGWGGGVVSTAQDYARFAQMLLNYGELDGVRLLSRKSVELMTTNLTGNLPLGGPVPAGYGWGLGLSVLRDLAGIPGIGSVGRFGWYGAADTAFLVDPKEDLIAIRLTQVVGGGGAALRSFTRNVFDTLVYQALDD